MAGAPAAAAEPSAPAAPQIQEHAFFPVATHKLVVMSICTFGFYELYWCYKNWQRIKERSREDLSPFWRAFFAPFWGFSLFERVHEAAERRKLGVGWSAGLLGALYFVLSITWRLPDPWWLISVMTFAPFIPVVQTVRAINATEPVAEGPNAAYSGGNIATIIIGGLLVVLGVVSAFMPAEVGGASEGDAADGAVRSAREPLFREISIAPLGTVALDQPFAERGFVPLGAATYALVSDRGRFADTDSILVSVAPDERVSGMTFVYEAGKDYAAAASEYEGTLGPPYMRETADSVGSRIERVVWQDERTRFELRRVTPASGNSRVSSILSSRQATR